jgi:hypothetical protein
MIENNTRYTHERAGAVEYAMPEGLAQEILKTRKGTEKNMHPEDFLVKVVNETFGLKEKCVKVSRF